MIHPSFYQSINNCLSVDCSIVYSVVLSLFHSIICSVCKPSNFKVFKLFPPKTFKNPLSSRHSEILLTNFVLVVSRLNYLYEFQLVLIWLPYIKIGIAILLQHSLCTAQFYLVLKKAHCNLDRLAFDFDMSFWFSRPETAAPLCCWSRGFDGSCSLHVSFVVFMCVC